MHIGQAIRTTRERLGMTQEAVAMEAGWDGGNLSRLERGKQSVSLERLAKIARAMQVRVSDLFLLIEAPSAESERTLRDMDISRHDDDMHSVRRLYIALDLEHRPIALDMLKSLNKSQRKKTAEKKGGGTGDGAIGDGAIDDGAMEEIGVDSE